MSAALLLASTAVSAEPKTVTFVHINDLHAHLTPHLDRVAGVNGGTVVQERGGLARIRTVIDEIRAENPASIVMNIGDTYHGGVEALFTNGDAIVDPVDALGIDVGVPGNWDFGYGPQVTRWRYGPYFDWLPESFIKRPEFPNLAANVFYSIGPRQGQPFLPPTLLTERDGVKIGLIGLTSDIVPAMNSALGVGLDFLEGADEHLAVIEDHAGDLRDQGANIVVVMSELGIHKDVAIADRLAPGVVDAIFSAHTHEMTLSPVATASGTPVVEAGNDTWVGRMDITVDNGLVTGYEWELISVTSDYPENPEVAALVDAARAPFLDDEIDISLRGLSLTQPIDTVVGYTAIPLDRRNALQSTFNNAVTDVLRDHAGVDVALTNGFRYDTVIPAAGSPMEDNTVASGEITIEDLYRFFPFRIPLSSGHISGEALRLTMESALAKVFSTDAFVHEHGWFQGYSGIEATVDLSAGDGERIQEIVLKDSGEVISDQRNLTAAGCAGNISSDGSLCNQEGFIGVTPIINPASGSQLHAIDLLIETLQGGYLPVQERKDLTDLNATPMWPDSDYLQPIRGVE